MSELKVGIVGCGGMGIGLGRLCHALEDAKVTAVTDANQEAADALGAELGAQAYASHTDLIAGDVDAIIIATPNHLHAPITIEAAAKRKHVFCEKPMALSVVDCDAMIGACEKAGVKLMVGQVLRLIPVFWQTHKVVASGDLGAPFAMMVTRLSGPDSLTGQPWRVSREQSGGILYEVHVHELDFMRHVMGEAKSVYASVGHFTGSKLEYEDTAFVQVTYASGGVGVLHCGTSSSFGKYEMMVQCGKGTLVNGGFGGPIRYSLFGDEPTVMEASEIQERNGYQEELRSWVESITRGTPMVFDGYDGRAAIELAEAAYRSAAAGKPVKLPLKP